MMLSFETMLFNAQGNYRPMPQSYKRNYREKLSKGDNTSILKINILHFDGSIDN